MATGQSYTVSVTMKNTGTTTWTAANLYNLGSQNPQDNLTWGLGRVNVPADVPPNTEVTFTFTVTAPATTGTYNFQWRMVQDAVEWFGAYAPNVPIGVSPWSPPAAAINLALGKATTQSSEAYGGVCSRATDNNTNGDWAGNSVTHTGNDLHAWWQVDLGSTQSIGTIQVWNRTDCCSERLSNFYVFVSKAPFVSTDLTTTQNQEGVVSFYTPGVAGMATTIPVNRSGRYVRVQLGDANQNPLSLAEVKVWDGQGGSVVVTESAVNRSSVSEVNQGDVLISEFRWRGPNGALDEFVELYNKTNAPITVQAVDSSGGWALVGSDASVRFVIPNGTVIPAYGHYLAVNPNGYSLGAAAAGNTTLATADQSYTLNIPDPGGVALFKSATSFTVPNNRLDAVGFSGAGGWYREGVGLAPSSGVMANAEFSWVRKTVMASGLTNTGRPQDTNDNAADFVLVATNPAAITNATATLGSPGPENLSSPVQRNAQITATLVDPTAGITAKPNRERLYCDNPSVPTCDPNTSPHGYLAIRRTYTNRTSQPVTRLRFRIVDISTTPEGTGPTGNNIADVRAVTSPDVTISTTTEPSVLVRGTALETPPNQPSGGGLNSTVSAGTITTSTPLAPNGFIRVQFLLGIKQGGNFRFFVNVEALQTSCSLSDPTAGWISTEQFVKDFYQKVLRRPPTDGELSQWNDTLVQAYAQGQPQLLLAAQHLGTVLFQSHTYLTFDQERGQNLTPAERDQLYVTDLYQGYFNRPPDPEMTHWLNHLASGASREAVRDIGFARSGEFINRVNKLCPAGATSGSQSGTNYNLMGSVFSRARLDAMNRTGSGGDDPLSRNFNWSVPLVSLPGRAGLDLGLSLSYNSLVWSKGDSSFTYDADHGFPSPGFRLGFPMIQPRYFNEQTGQYAYLLITPSGSRIELRQVSSNSPIYESADSSYIEFDSSTLVLRTSDGTQLRYQLSGDDFQCREIKDGNGNYITVDYSARGDLQQITDTLKRQINFVYDANGNLNQITQRRLVAGSQTEYYNFTWASFGWEENLTLRTHFGGYSIVGAQNETTIPVLNWVGLADGSRYRFRYTSWGQAWKIERQTRPDDSYLTAPKNQQNGESDWITRAYTAYDLPQTASTEAADCPRFTKRSDWAENWNDHNKVPAEVTTTYSVTENGRLDPTTTTAVGTLSQVTTLDGTIQKTLFYAAGWQKGLPIATETWGKTDPQQTTAATRQRWTTHVWEQDDENVSYPLNPRPSQTHVHDAGSQRQTKVTYTAYVLPGSGTTYRLPTEVKEYGSDTSTALRRTETTYKVDVTADAAYLNRHIIGLVQEQKTYGIDQLSTTEKLAAWVQFTYDAGGEFLKDRAQMAQHDETNYSLNFRIGRGNVTSVRRQDADHPAAGGPSRVVSSTGYDTAGSVTFTRDGSDHQTKIEYDDSSVPGENLQLYAYPKKVTDADGYESTSEYSYNTGAVTKTKKPSRGTGSTITYLEQELSYDAAGRLKKISNGVNSAYTSWEYPADLLSVVSHTTVNNVANDATTVKTLDGAGRVRGTSVNRPGTVGGYSGQKFLYDVVGQLEWQTTPTEIDDEWVPKGDDATGTAGEWPRWTRQTYDWKGRPLVTTNTDGTTKTAAYSGCGCAGGEVVTVAGEVVLLPPQGGAGAWTTDRRRQRAYHDVLGRAVKNEVLNRDGTAYMTTVTEYNGRDQVISVKQYKGAATADGSCPTGTCQVTMMGYDGYGRLQSRRLPEEAAPTTYTYNPDDTLQQEVDPREVTSTYDYNHRHLVTGITYSAPSGITATAALSFDYDAAGNRTSQTDMAGTVTYRYDTLSRLEAETRKFTSLNNSPYTLSYTYNLANQVTSLTDPMGARIDYDYDSAGSLNKVTGTPYGSVTQYASGMKYRAWGALKEMAYGNGLKAELGYNSRLQVARYRVGLPNTQPGAGDRAFSEYEYEADGRVKQTYDRTDGGFDRSYLYDLVGRLVHARTSSSAYYQSYSYDEFGHMTHRGNGSWRFYENTFSEYLNNRNTKTTTGPPSYPSCCPPQPVVWSYDAAGNVTRDHNKEYTFDAAGNKVRVLETTSSGGATKRLWIYQDYNADGERVKRTEQTQVHSGPITTVTSYFVRSSVLDSRVVTEVDQSGTKKRTYVYANGAVLAQQESDQVRWVHSDPVTNSLRETAADGSLASRLEFDPLGNDVPLEDPAPPDPPTPDYEYAGNYNNSGNPYDGASGCTLDGQPLPCSFVMGFINTGAAAQCPDNRCRPGLRLTDDGFDYWDSGLGGGIIVGVVDARTGAGWQRRRARPQRRGTQRPQQRTTQRTVPTLADVFAGRVEYTEAMRRCDEFLAALFGDKGAIMAANGFDPTKPGYLNGKKTEGVPQYRGDYTYNGVLQTGHLSNYAAHLYNSNVYVPAGGISLGTPTVTTPGQETTVDFFYYERLSTLS